MKTTVTIERLVRELLLERSADGYVAREGDRAITIDLRAVGPHEAELLVDGHREIIPYVLDGETVHFFFRGESLTATVAPDRPGRRRRESEASMSAPMPGTVLQIPVEAGASVRKGETLIVLEAMKMEHRITSPRDGIVAEIRCREGEMVQPGVDLIALEEGNDES